MIATVVKPVHDTVTGKFLLIPKGASVLGKYNGQVNYGQRRIQVVCNRVVLPNTSSLTLVDANHSFDYAGLGRLLIIEWE